MFSKIIKLPFLFLVFLATLHMQAKDNNVYAFGGIVQTDPSKHQLTLVFTGADMADGADAILNTLKENHIKAAFFLTGKFYEKYPEIINRIVKEKHYLGTHGYAHLLYSTWEDRNKMLVTRQEFEQDILHGYQMMENIGISAKKAPYFIPAYEHYNDTISNWARHIGLQVINCSGGCRSAADYTTPDMKNYCSSEYIYNNILDYEKENSLNGHLMLFHIGTVNARTDKFYNGHLDRLIKELKRRGYKFVQLKKAIGKQN